MREENAILSCSHVGCAGLRDRERTRAVGGTPHILGVLVVSVLLMRHWFARHNAMMRNDLERLATERRALEHTAYLVERQTAVNQQRIDGIRERLCQTLDDLSAEHGKRLIVERERRELTEEYNLLIQETLLAGEPPLPQHPLLLGLSDPAIHPS
ncbi:hypothetical protein [Streptomyces sp900116325]|uniref:hypothetical protein n=1 Tax=Streptomyces sp. 900116325 TaxID=3154295 RepID=UPI0033B32083